MKFFFLWAAFLLTALCSGLAADQPRVLVYTKNQVGQDAAGKAYFVHDNIAASVIALKKLGAENHFDVEISEDPAAFTPTNLQRFKVIVFDNSNNEILDTGEQKAALRHYVEAGGGIVGIHSASGSMRQWPWFWAMMGGKFARHPKLQTFAVKVKDAKNPSTAPFPASFPWTDEFYYLTNMPAALHILLAGNLTTLVDPLKDQFKNPQYGDEVPLCWCQQFDSWPLWMPR